MKKRWSPARVATGVMLAAWAGLFWFLRERYWRRAGYWFSSARLIIDDGSRVFMVPYEEIALSSLALEADGRDTYRVPLRVPDLLPPRR